MAEGDVCKFYILPFLKNRDLLVRAMETGYAGCRDDLVKSLQHEDVIAIESYYFRAKIYRLSEAFVRVG